MEVLPTPGPGGPTSGQDAPSVPERSGAQNELNRRLADLEFRLDALGERLGGLETTVRVAVAEEVQAATGEMRRAITELGRRLVQDLPHELRRHRDAIVAELRPPPPPPAPPPAVPELAEEPPRVEVDEATVPVASDPPEDADRRRASRRRRRHG